MTLSRAVRRTIAPQLRNSTWAYREILETTMSGVDRWLDIGCGHQLLPSWMPDGLETAKAIAGQCRVLVGVDGDLPALSNHQLLKHRLLTDVECLPFASASFDLVTANMVIEHLSTPQRMIAEVARVLKPGGRFIFHTPNRLFWLVRLSSLMPASFKRRVAGLLEGRPLEDVYPTHYRLNTPEEIERCARAHGMRIDDLRLLNSGVATGRLGALAIPELVMIRVLESDRFAHARSNMIVILRKADRDEAVTERPSPA